MNTIISQGFNIPNDISIISAIENYKTNIDLQSVEIFEKYVEIVSKYITYFRNTISVSNNVEYYKYILIKGINTICHVFRILFLYTKNIELVIYHCEKSFFYYIEFIKQIDENNHNLLSLNSNDASYFVFKKTIYEINNEYRKKFNEMDFLDENSSADNIIINSNENIGNNYISSNDNYRKINTSNIMINIYNRLLIKVVHSTILRNSGSENKNNISIANSSNSEKSQVISFESKMTKLFSIILQYLKGENEKDTNRFLQLLKIIETFILNYKNNNKCIVPYMDAFLKKIKKITNDNTNNNLIDSSKKLNELCKLIQTSVLYMDNDNEKYGSLDNNIDNSLTPSNYIKLLIRE